MLRDDGSIGDKNIEEGNWPYVCIIFGFKYMLLIRGID